MTDGSWDGRTCTEDCTSNPGGVGLRPADTPVGARVARSRRVETREDGRAGDVCGHSEEVGSRHLVSKERAAARRYSAQWRGRLYPVRLAGSSLNLSDGRFTGIGVLHDCRLNSTGSVTRKVDEKLRLPSTSRGWHGSVALDGEVVVARSEAYEL